MVIKSLLEPSSAPLTPPHLTSPLSSSPLPPYVPPYLRQASKPSAVPSVNPPIKPSLKPSAVPSIVPSVKPFVILPLAIPSVILLAVPSSVKPSADPSLIPPSASPPFLTHTSIVKGCFYCHNTHGTRHMHRNKCPWFRYYLDISTCYLNDVGELYLGLKRRGTIPLPFWDMYISQGEQVKRRTDGTEWDEEVGNRARNPVVFRH